MPVLLGRAQVAGDVVRRQRLDPEPARAFDLHTVNAYVLLAGVFWRVGIA